MNPITPHINGPRNHYASTATHASGKHTKLWRFGLSALLGLAVLGSPFLQAQTETTVIPQEYTSGMRNPLMGFREGQQSGPHSDASIPTESVLLSRASNKLADLSLNPYCVLVRDYIHFNVMNDNASDTAQRIIDYSNAAYKDYETKNIKVIPRVILMYTDGNTPRQEYWPSDLTDGDWTSQAVRDRVAAVVRKLGEAWDNDSRIAWVQMGLIGQWGEQESPVGIDQDLGGGVTWAKVLEPVFKEAFTNKKVLVRSPEKWGADFQVGMYWDTFAANGKMNGPTDEWNRLKANNLAPRESYIKAPIEGEVAYNFIVASQMGTSPQSTLQNATYRQFFIDTVRSSAATTCGIEYDPSISANTFGASEVQKAFGYRFLLKEFTYANRVEPGATFNFSAKVVNAGSAPTYAKWPLSVVLIDEATKQIVWTSPAVPTVDITQWLPGTGYQWNFVDGQAGTGARTYANPAPTNVITGAVTIPSNLATSSYLVGLSILDPTTNKPGIFFSTTNFLQASNTQPLARIGVGMNAATGAIAFDPYNWLNDTRRYNLTSGPAPTTVTIAATDATAAEPSDNGAFTVTRTGTTTAALTVNFNVGGTATSPSDYQNIGTSVTIAAGQSTAVVPVTVVNDFVVESSETIVITLTNNAAYTVGAASSSTVTIADDDVVPPTVTIAATDATAAEPSDNGAFTVTRTGSTAAALTVNFTVGGTATSPSDYQSIGTLVTIAAGQSTAAVPVTVVNDFVVESSETVVITLANNAAYTVGAASSSTVTITDDDVVPPTVTIAATDATAAEPSDNGAFTVTRTGSTTAALTVNFGVGGTAATNGTDYTSIGTSVTIAAGQSSAVVPVTIVNDSVVESSETVIMTLANNAAYTVGAAGSATVTIADDDVVLPTVTIAATTANAAEPSTNGSYTITRTGSTSSALTVSFTVSGTATSGTDYTTLGTSVVISAGQASATTTVAVQSDTIAESSESVIVTLANNAAYTLGSPSSATVNIADAPPNGLPWVVNFNGLPAGTTNQGAPTSWTATRGGTFSVATDRLQINGAGGEGVFTSGVISIAGVTANLSLGVQGAGGLDSGDYMRLYLKVDGGAETLINQVSGAQAATTWTKNGIMGSTLQVVIRTSVSAADEFYYFDNLSVSQAAGGLPSPWQTTDVGAVGATGSASFSSPTWTVTGSGADIWGTADEFRYVYQTASADCSIVVRVASIQNTNAWAKAGVMIRETTAANAQTAILCVSPTSGVAFQYRATTGGSMVTNQTVAGQSAPKYLRLTRTGNSFAAYRSDDNLTWTQVGTAQTINMATGTTIGMAVTSHNDGTLCTSAMEIIGNVTP